MVRLTLKDVEVLGVLLAGHGELVDRRVIFTAVWKGVVVEDCNLARHVANLRRVLGDDPERPTYIETVPRRGYRFLAPVVVSVGDRALDPAAAAGPIELGAPRGPQAPAVSDEAAGSAEGPLQGPGVVLPHMASPATSAGAHKDRAASTSVGRRTPALAKVIAGATAFALVVLLPAATVLSHPRQGGMKFASVALLPVTNLTGDPGNDQLAEALGEMTSNDLGRLRQARLGKLRVLPVGAAGREAGGPRLAASTGRALGVDGVLETNVLKADDRVRIGARLIDTRTGALAWAHELEGEAGAFLALQDDLVLALAVFLELEPGLAQLTREAQLLATGL
jgi:TolB-like protein